MILNKTLIAALVFTALTSLTQVRAQNDAHPATHEKKLVFTAKSESWPNLLIRVENGPVFADEKNLTLKFDVPALQRAVGQLARTAKEDGRDFYREIRNFREAKVRLMVTYADGTVVRQEFEVDGHGPSEVSMEHAKILKSFAGDITGVRDVYKCFDPNTCVFEKTIDEWRDAQRDATAYIKIHKLLLDCGEDGYVIGNILEPEQQEFKLENEKIGFYLQILDMSFRHRGDPVRTGEEFKGFSQVVEAYATFSEPRGSAPVRIMYLTREEQGLKIRVESQPHYRCHYQRPKAPLNYWKLATPLEDECEPASGDWAFIGARDRVETVINKERIIPKCKELKENVSPPS